MNQASTVLAVNDDLPIKTDKPVHSGKVRSVYWLTEADSARLIKERGYNVAADAPLAVMVISDRISAFDCIWRAEGGLDGVPGKGAALNTIAAHWFSKFKDAGLADSHILEIPHPLVWIVQKARPIMIEAICRNYITGSMWRAYEKGEREFCGESVANGLEKDQKLPELIVTPSTKGVIKGVAGVPEADDVNISRAQIEDNYQAFNFSARSDIPRYEHALTQGFKLIEAELQKVGQIFVDTKFEFGYVTDAQGKEQLIYMDEVGTPDSSRMWSADAYQRGQVVENSKEGFRQFLLNHFDDPDILLNKDRMDERESLAANNFLPSEALLDLSRTYIQMAETITGQTLKLDADPRASIISVLTNDFGLIDAKPVAAPATELYPDIEPYRHQLLPVDDLHQIYVEECGNPEGVPILFVHGGPGGGCSVRDRRFFDPDHYRIILFDQRGCGRSLPHGELTANTTEHLVADIEAVREALDVDRWHLFGGSWGSTLSLVYAEAHPERVLSLTLRGIWLARQQDADWAFNAGGAHRVFPEMWSELINEVRPAANESVIDRAYAIMTSDDEGRARAVAKAWARWEISACTLQPNANYLAEATGDNEAWTLARHEAHFMVNRCFIAPNHILDNANRLANIPTTIVHGRYDMVCPVDQAILLAKAMPHAKLVITDNAGHASAEPKTLAALVTATNTIRDN